MTERIVADDGSIRWILWRGAPAALVSELFVSTGGCNESAEAIAVRHTLLVWNGERFEKRDTLYTTFHEKYP